MEKYRIFFIFYHFDTNPKFPQFILYVTHVGGNQGSLLYGDFTIMHFHFKKRHCRSYLSANVSASIKHGFIIGLKTARTCLAIVKVQAWSCNALNV